MGLSPFCGCGKGTVLPCWKLWGTIHEMEHTAAREGPRSSRVHQYLPYLAHQARYQRLWTTFGFEILWGSTQIHPNWNGFFSTSHHSVLLIDMMLKSSRNLNTKTNGSSSLQIHNNQGMTKMTLTKSLPKNSPSHRKRRVMGRQRRTPENGAISTKAPGTTPMNVAQNNHWWLEIKENDLNPNS